MTATAARTPLARIDPQGRKALAALARVERPAVTVPRRFNASL